jgi:poly(3-hydroxybutyrate) depolymerase
VAAPARISAWHLLGDTWYRNPDENLDALAIDHFLDEVIETGLIDTDRIYVFGWSNGGYMTALYGIWRKDRIAATGQYAAADPWTQLPCPGTLPDEQIAVLPLGTLFQAAA